jgi:hypothetical protein
MLSYVAFISNTAEVFDILRKTTLFKPSQARFV